MIKHNFIFAIRHLLKNKTYSIINLLGLTIGFSCAILLLLDVHYILSFDRFHKNYNQLYTINSWKPEAKDKGYMSNYYSALVGPLLKEQVPEVEDFIRIRNEEYVFKTEDVLFLEKGIYADRNFFTVFSFPLIEGEKNKALNDDHSIIISDKMAEKFFGAKNCIGKTLTLKKSDSYENYQIAGVFKVPVQSSLKLDFVIPFSKFLADNKWADKYSSLSTSIWLLIKKNTDKADVTSKIDNVIRDKDPVKEKRNILIPLKEKHLYNYMYGKRLFMGSILDVVINSVIALVILLLGCFNFMNLSIAWTTKRSGESGIKKSLGSTRKSIIIQFLTESMILSFISLLMALLIVALVLPYFNSLSSGQKELSIPFADLKIMSAYLGMALIAGLLAGIYPAVLLSYVKVIDILKNNLSLKVGINYFRQGLIIFQFLISVVFIILSFVVWKQADYLKTKDLGINKDNILFFQNHQNISKHQSTFKNELLSLPEVGSVCYSNNQPFLDVKNGAKVDWTGKDPAEDRSFLLINTDFDFFKTLQPVLLKGRCFDEGFPTDANNFVINESGEDIFNLKEIIGQPITVNGQKGSIIGVVKNFHTHTLFLGHLPLIIRIDPLSTQFTIVKFFPNYRNTVMESLKSKYKKFESDFPFEAQFASDIYYRQNGRDQAAIFTSFFATIAIFLACFGLYGLSSFMIEKRTKEIGIRKINGATIFYIVLQLLRSYLKWIAIAVVIGVPVALFLSKAFLGIFAFRTEIPIWAFVVGPLIILSLALATVISKAIHAAMKNPVEALRYE